MKKLRIITTGLIGSIPMAGLTLHYLQYVLGLRELGHEVLYLEDTGTWYYDPETDSMIDEIDLPIGYLRHIMTFYGLQDNWTFVDHHGTQHGITGKRFDDYIRTADILINVTGAGIIRNDYLDIPERIYVDTDPSYIQMRVAQGSKKDLDHLRRHTTHFSFGCNIGKPTCRIPTVGIQWNPTRQPIFLDLWPVAPPPSPKALFTTILKWQTYVPMEHEGETYGLKNTEFLKFLELPGLTGHVLEIAMAGDPPVENLESAGWHFRNARSVSATIDEYRAYIQGSRGEWSIAKNGYVKTRSGWFSDRSAAYLASGRPVILQSTGFEDWLRVGRGLLTFSSMDEAAAAVEAINKDYDAHSKGARETAVEYFDSRMVISDMLSVV